MKRQIGQATLFLVLAALLLPGTAAPGEKYSFSIVTGGTGGVCCIGGAACTGGAGIAAGMAEVCTVVSGTTGVAAGTISGTRRSRSRPCLIRRPTPGRWWSRSAAAGFAART